MRIAHKDLNKGIVKVEVENVDDLWYLNQIIEPHDLGKCRTIRKIKIGDENNPRIIKKQITLTINIESMEFHESTGNLRVAGKIIDGPDDFPRGNYHTFTLEPKKEITIIKKHWAKHSLDKLKESQEKAAEYLVVLFDREKAMFAELKKRNYKILTTINASVQKKDAPDIKSENIYKTIVKQITEYTSRTEYQSIIAGSAGFWKEYLEKEVTPEIKKKLVFATISNVSPSGLNELIKRPELKQLLSKERMTKELQLVDKILEAIAREKACYGLKDCDQKITEGNIKMLLVSNNFIMKLRQENRFGKLNFLMKTADQLTAEIHIISNDEALKQIDNLGGVCGVTRW